jgi:hypothetical protein
MHPTGSKNFINMKINIVSFGNSCQ